MPYRSTDDLPPAVRDHLPEHAREIFVAAFNAAWEAHAADPGVEAVAFRIAWAAVKRSYRKRGSAWVPR
jgi:cation transport regulator